MSKVIAAFLAMVPWIIYIFRALDKGTWEPALGGALCLGMAFYFIWFRLEEVD